MLASRRDGFEEFGPGIVARDQDEVGDLAYPAASTEVSGSLRGARRRWRRCASLVM
jgi:hypothetical protein